MEEEKKKSVKKNVVTGAAMAGGIAAGVGIGATMFAQEAQAEETLESIVEPPSKPLASTPAADNHHSNHQSTPEGQHTDATPVAEVEQSTPETETPTPAEEVPTEEGSIVGEIPEEEVPDEDIQSDETPSDPLAVEVEVLSYDHVIDETGNEMDIAVVNIDGEEVSFIDSDLDGQVNVMAYDENGDGIVASTEHFHVEDMNISMAPFQDAAAEPSYLAVNDPVESCDFPGDYTNDDYINDADINSFMA